VAFNPQLPALDAVATRGPDGHTIYLAVVNSAQNEAVSTQVRLQNWQPAGTQAEVYELNGRTWDAFNPSDTASTLTTPGPTTRFFNHWQSK
jgi:alpha-L-arabinofuranosidase